MLSDIKAESREYPGYMEKHIRTLNALIDELYYITASYQEELDSYLTTGTPETSDTEQLDGEEEESDEEEPSDAETCEDDLKMEDSQESLHVSLAQHTPNSSEVSSL